MDAGKAKYLILSIDQNGDPINANAPGSYDDPGVVHNTLAPELGKATMKLGDQTVTGAQVWSTLPQPVLDRTCFFHMATQTTIHPDLPKVQRMMGATAGQEMLPSIFSGYLSSCLSTIQAAPVSLVGTTAAEFVTYQGRVLPNLNALALRNILTHPQGPLTQLMGIRDQAMDRIHARLKASGTATGAQKAFIDSLARSRAEARSIGEQLLADLDAIADNGADGQILGAATLIKMNVAPVVVLRVPFGGDNHFDANLATEATQTVSGVATIGKLIDKLQSYQLQDKVVFATLNVFGRTLKQLGQNGRNHWADHHVSVMIGKTIKAGVVGGLQPAASKNDYTAMSIDSKSGRGVQNGDVPMTDTLTSFGKTLGVALGVPQPLLDQNILKGKVVPGALNV